MSRLRAVSGVVAGLALVASAARAQDTASRGARAIDLAAARAVAQDSVAASTRRWRDALARSPDDRFAALGLASLARLTYDSAADGALARLARGSDAIARRALLDRAAWLSATGHFNSADSLYAQAVVTASLARDSLVEAEATLGRVTVALDRVNPKAAERLFPVADSVRPPSDSWLAAASACARAAIHPSDSALRAATAQADRIGDGRLAASCLYPLPIFLYYSRGYDGPSDSSDRITAEILTRLRRAGDASTLGVALMLRCYRRLTALDYSGSAADCEGAVREGRAVRSPYTVGWAELNLGSLSRLLGDEAAARAHNARSRLALTAISDRTGLAILRRNDADLALDAGDTGAARGAAMDALRDAAPGIDSAAAWRRLADVALRERRFVEARRDLDSDIAAAVRGHMDVFVPSVKLQYGTILLREGRPREALDRLNASAYDSSQVVSRYLVEEQRAEALLALGRRTQALTTMERATDELERWRATLSDRELRVLAFQTRPLFGGPSPAIAAVVASAVDRGQSGRAFALAERRRARDLEDQRRRAAVMGGADDRVDGSRAAGPALSLAALRQSVPDDSTAVLEYVTGPVGAPTTVFAITRSTARARTLMPADSATDAIALFDALIDKRRDARAVGRALGARVLGPALALLPRRIVRLVIVADGPLQRIPFAALRLADGSFVVARYAVALAPSATVAVGLWAHPSPIAGLRARVLAFGDALSDDLDGPESLPAEGARATSDSSDEVERMGAVAVTPEVSLAAALAEDPQVATALPRLPWSADEARMVAAFGRGSVAYVGREATPATLGASPLDSFAIVHFATHAIVDEQVPARSALVLSAPRPRESGLVSAGSLDGRRIAAALVVLSACRTARGALVEGEGVRGLANPFLGAGAHAVLATQWGVGDRSVVPLVYAIYRGLADGLPVAEALRQAELGAQRRAAPVREWAAFTLIGDPLVRVNLQTPSPESVPEWVRSPASGLAPGNQ